MHRFFPAKRGFEAIKCMEKIGPYFGNGELNFQNIIFKENSKRAFNCKDSWISKTN
jgi:hypothetical protein